MRYFVLKVVASLVLLSPSLCGQHPSNESPFMLENTGFVLKNPGLPSNFHTIGVLRLDNDHLTFQPYSNDSSLTRPRLYRYNFLVKDFKIEYKEIDRIYRGCYFVFFIPVASKLVIKLRNGHKYHFDLLNRKKEILEFVRPRIQNIQRS